MSKILKQIINDWNYQKKNNPESTYINLTCNHCNKTVLFIKKHIECVNFNCCLDCLPLYQKVDLLIKDIKDGCFDFDIEKKVFSNNDYKKSYLVNFLVSNVGLDNIVNYLKDSGKIDNSPILETQNNIKDFIGSTYELLKPKKLGHTNLFGKIKYY